MTSAISSRPNATFRPGLYGDGDASDDQSRQRWVIDAIDKRTGKTLWERVASEGEPHNKRHIKSTNSMGEPLMATPALSEGVMYVRSSRTLFAIGRR